MQRNPPADPPSPRVVDVSAIGAAAAARPSLSPAAAPAGHHLWAGRRPSRRVPKKGESANPDALSCTVTLGRQRLGGQVPESRIEPDLLLDRGNPTRMTQPAAGRAAAQASTQERFLAAVQDGPEIIPGVLDPPADEELRGLHAGL